jgi:hypothetical protein
MSKELINWINNPTQHTAKELADWYFNKGQTASALSYYLRVTEFNEDLTYYSLCKAAICLNKQGNRLSYSKDLLLHAISINSKGIEAYHLLSKVYEWKREWIESYTYANIGLELNDNKIIKGLEWIGKGGFLFQKAVSGWWINRIDESLKLFLDLEKNYDLPIEYKKSIKENIKLITNSWVYVDFYSKNKYDSVKYKFKGLENIKSNYSQCYQDLFILTVLDGKREGKYLEIGSADPWYYSNTALLETEFDWNGISLEIKEDEVLKFQKERKNECIQADALKVNWEELLNNKGWGNEWDYLQLDCEPPINTYLILLDIPFDKFKFRVITFEHDYYTDDTKSFRDKSRRYLTAMGYELVVSNISPDDNSPFEDWWVHPDLVDRNIIDTIKDSSNTIKKAEKYIYNRL